MSTKHLYVVSRIALLANDAKPPLSINGVEIPYEFDTPCDLDDDAAHALANTFGFTVTPVDGSDAEPQPEPEQEPEGEPDLNLSVIDTDTQSPVGDDGGDGAASPDGGAVDGGADSTTEQHPLDHDGDGKKGGSLPKARRTKKAAA